jgi:tetratricopeptide (TPR) repeat protein
VVTATAFDRSTARGHVSRPITIVVPAAVPGASAPAGADRPPAPSDAAPPAKAFERDDLLRPDALDYFLSRLRVADEADATPAVQSAADAAARGDFRAVLSGLDAAEPTSLSVPALKGLALFATGAVEPAALQFRASLQISREFLPAAFYLGACYAASGRDEQAAAAWQIVLLAEGDEPFIFEALADAWLRLQNGEQALAVLARARQRWPDEARFVWRTSAAQALVKKGSWPVSVP